MSHRGQNTVAFTPQLWNGTRWVPYNALSFQTSITTVASSVWVDTDSAFGHTTGTNVKNSLSQTTQGTNPVFSEQKFYLTATGDGGGVDPQVFQFPTTIRGVSPSPAGGAEVNLMVAEITATASHSGGSDFPVAVYRIVWRFSGGVWVHATDLEVANTDTGIFTVVGSVDGANIPQVTVDYANFPGDTLKYMLRVNLMIMGNRP